MTIQEYLKIAVEKKASDIHIGAGIPVTYRIKGRLVQADDIIITHEVAMEYTKSIMTEESEKILDEMGEVDFAYSMSGVARFRVNVFMQRSTYAAVLRIILSNPPSCSDINLPQSIIEFTKHKSGLMLIVGPTGSGKSTTLAALINEINKTRAENIITLEDPIEFLHKSDKSIVRQREVGCDTKSYVNALRAVLRQDPDVILVGEMRDLDTTSIAITAAETGHLVFSTMHTMGAVKTLDRITDSFPPHQQNQIRHQLSTALRGVVSQQLLPTKDGRGRVAAFEIMISNPAIANLIRENKTSQMMNVLQTSRDVGMITMDAYLTQLIKEDKITVEMARIYAFDKSSFSSKSY